MAHVASMKRSPGKRSPVKRSSVKRGSGKGELARQSISMKLLRWYDRHARDLPWRMRGPARADPYRVWLSEIMLQQTTVVTVQPYFQAFTARWPSIQALAAAPLDQVLSAWAGLGYYARARNLHACAGKLCQDHGGHFPETEAELLKLPGIGPYTAAAISAIAFGRRACVVDGNVERVAARLFAVETPLPKAKAELRDLTKSLLPPGEAPAFRYGDFAQAMMDLGATVCVPGRPRCEDCPLAGDCAARAAGLAETLPRRAPKRARPTRLGVAFWVLRGDGAVLLRRRPERGLLGGMMEVPSTEWREAVWTKAEARTQAPFTARWTVLPGVVRHTFTHFDLELEVWAGKAGAEWAKGEQMEEAARWVSLDQLDQAALPTAMRKVINHALDAVAPSGV